MPYEEYEYHISKIPPNNTERDIFFAGLRKKFEEDILTNPKYDRYFSNFRPQDRTTFAHIYSRKKSEVIQMQAYLSQEKNVSHKALLASITDDCYWMIGQKKLFNLQLQWRAGLLRLPGLYCSHHFEFWQKNIRQCPYVGLISDNEVEVMKSYLSGSGEHLRARRMRSSWQYYSEEMLTNPEIKSAEYPDWYDYYDNVMGTGEFLLLPNIIGDLETKYMHTAWKHEAEEQRRQVKSGEKKTYKSEKHPEREHYDMFAKEFEHRYIQYLHKRLKRLNDDREEQYFDAFEVESEAKFLKRQNVPAYTQGGIPWYHDIMECADRSRRDSALGGLDAVHEKYRQLYDSGQMNYITEPDYKSLNRYPVSDEETILAGRAILGEPKNFDYLPMGY